MPCNDLTGSPFVRGVLVREGTEEIDGLDPVLRFVMNNGQLFARFDGSGNEFPVTCTEEGVRRRLHFTRIEGNVTTEYRGLAVPLLGRATFYIVHGTYTRVTTQASGTQTTTRGDWETEKPT